jgi:hypothetical protein
MDHEERFFPIDISPLQFILKHFSYKVIPGPQELQRLLLKHVAMAFKVFLNVCKG